MRVHLNLEQFSFVSVAKVKDCSLYILKHFVK